MGGEEDGASWVTLLVAEAGAVVDGFCVGLGGSCGDARAVGVVVASGVVCD